MGEILFLAHRMPFPPDRGDKIRSHHLLKALAKFADVHVGCFGDTDGDFDHEDALRSVSKSHILLRRSKSMIRAGGEAVAKGLPVSLTAFDHSDLHDWVRKILAERDIETIFIFSGQMGQYVPDNYKGRLVVDLCDVDSVKFESYAEKGRFPRKWVDAREGRLLGEFEKQLAQRADHTLFVSEVEGQLFRSRIGEAADAQISALRNGIDAVFFDPALVQGDAEMKAQQGPHLVFTGQMDYAPNIGAAERVMDSILPKIRETFPHAMFHIVGRAPTAKLIARDGKAGVRVWGEVPDVRPYIAAADLVIAPLQIARGIQNKVLEAMAMARPVIASSEAATGIDAQDMKHFAIGRDDGELIARALHLLQDKDSAQKMALAAREYVTHHQGWDAMLAPLADLCLNGPAEPYEDAA